MGIRYLRAEEYEEICKWWAAAGEPVPPREVIPAETFILENSEGVPWVCLSLMGFSTKWAAWSIGLVSNPSLPRAGRKKAVQTLWDFVGLRAKELGYKNLFCVAPNKKLEKRYHEVGFQTTLQDVSLMMKVL
jgi:hypothetical protein